MPITNAVKYSRSAQEAWDAFMEDMKANPDRFTVLTDKSNKGSSAAGAAFAWWLTQTVTQFR